MAQETLTIRLLGTLEVLRGGEPVALPRSKKARALVAYLVATGRAHARSHLFDLLWEGPADPRAALRWSLSKIRPLLNDETATRLVTPGGRVKFEAHGARVDLHVVRELTTPDPSEAPTEALEEAAACFRGGFLDGLDLPECYRFDAWLTAEREAARRLHDAVLAALVERLRSKPDAALRYARARVLLDPYSEAAHVELVRLLGELGRTNEVLEQYDACRQMLKQEFGRRPSPEMEKVRQAVTAPKAAPRPAPPPTSRRASPSLPPLFGRRAEREAVEEMVTAAASGAPTDVLLVTGAPGIGKTRLLEELGARVHEAGGCVLAGCAYDVEMGRPYGAWIDALRAVPPEHIPEPVRAALASLLPELGPASVDVQDRNRLFDAVLRLLVHLSTAEPPVAVVLDDLHWLDEASLALLHYVARGTADRGILLAGAARPAELDEYPAARRLVQALRRNQRLRLLELAPLDADDTTSLVRGVDPDLDAVRVVRASEGNPLFALEIARSMQRGGRLLSDTLDGLIGSRLAALDPSTHALLPWAAALGHGFELDVLSRVADLSPADLLRALEDLERHGIIRAAGEGRYDFAHNLIRRVAYRKMSAPRRRLVHLQIARALAGEGALDEARAGTIAHHAARGGDHELAAQACFAAGRYGLRIFAYEDAAALAERGLSHVAALPPETRLPLHLDLLGLYVHPGMEDHQPDRLDEALRRATAEAQEAGLDAQVQNGFYLIGLLYFQRGDFHRALDVTLRAEEAGRRADPVTVVRAIADTARCLGMLGREMARAEKLAREAQSLADEFDLDVDGCELPLALGLVHRHAGELDEALRHVKRAVARSCRDHHPWWEYYCRSWLPILELERGRPDEALARCDELRRVTEKMGAGSEATFAAALEALARYALGEEDALPTVEAAVERLRTLDSQWMLAYVQLFAAGLELDRSRLESARARAEDALRAAQTVDRPSEVALARALLARLSVQAGDRTTAQRHLDAVAADAQTPHRLSARARRAFDRAAALLDG